MSSQTSVMFEIGEERYIKFIKQYFKINRSMGQKITELKSETFPEDIVAYSPL